MLQNLYAHDQLNPNQTPLSQSVLVRAGRPYGLCFSVQGPPRVETYAIWVGEEDRVLFYDANGVRFVETCLVDGPDPRKLVA